MIQKSGTGRLVTIEIGVVKILSSFAADIVNRSGSRRMVSFIKSDFSHNVAPQVFRP